MRDQTSMTVDRQYLRSVPRFRLEEPALVQVRVVEGVRDTDGRRLLAPCDKARPEAVEPAPVVRPQCGTLREDPVEEVGQGADTGAGHAQRAGRPPTPGRRPARSRPPTVSPRPGTCQP